MQLMILKHLQGFLTLLHFQYVILRCLICFSNITHTETQQAYRTAKCLWESTPVYFKQRFLPKSYGRNSHVTLQQVSSHHEIKGNDEAYKFAREAVKMSLRKTASQDKQLAAGRTTKRLPNGRSRQDKNRKLSEQRWCNVSAKRTLTCCVNALLPVTFDINTKFDLQNKNSRSILKFIKSLQLI